MPKKKKREKDYCKKCGTFTWLDEHHPLPQSIFGGEGGTVKLCPTCHREYHQFLGTENLKNPSMEYHFYMFSKWFYGLQGIILIGSIGILSVFFYTILLVIN
jgi:hypothetical protein